MSRRWFGEVAGDIWASGCPLECRAGGWPLALVRMTISIDSRKQQCLLSFQKTDSLRGFKKLQGVLDAIATHQCYSRLALESRILSILERI